jgi:hypothetical protein
MAPYVPAAQFAHTASLVVVHGVDVNWPEGQLVQGVQVAAFDVVE